MARRSRSANGQASVFARRLPGYTVTSGESIPAYALFGRNREVSLASSTLDKSEALVELVDRLVGMGHRRIVNIATEDRRKPTPGALERLYLEQLQKHGIRTGSYNLPDWEEEPEGLIHLLDSLLKHTPPTAVLVDKPTHFFAIKDYLGRRGLHSPEHVSMACLDYDLSFEWCRPSTTHVSWNSSSIINRVVKWVNNVSRRKEDYVKQSTQAKLVLGGTIGPAAR